MGSSFQFLNCEKQATLFFPARDSIFFVSLDHSRFEHMNHQILLPVFSPLFFPGGQYRQRGAITNPFNPPASKVTMKII